MLTIPFIYTVSSFFHKYFTVCVKGLVLYNRDILVHTFKSSVLSLTYIAFFFKQHLLLPLVIFSYILIQTSQSHLARILGFVHTTVGDFSCLTIFS